MTAAAFSKQAVIGYDNVFTAGTLSASSDPEGGEKENAVDGFTFDFWKPTGAGPHTLQVALGQSPGSPCDYVAIHKHNLDEIGGTIKLQGSDDGSHWTDIMSAKSPTDGGAWLWRFTQATYPYWRFYITGTDPEIAVLQAGAATVLETGLFVGINPPTLNPRNQIMNQGSEGGEFLGRSLLRTGVAISLQLNHVDPVWVRSTWIPFTLFAETSPFFFAWRHGSYPEEVIYCWSAGDATVQQSHVSFMQVAMPLEGQA